MAPNVHREIVPALLVESKEQFERQLRLVEQNCSLIQVDALDGTLFPNTNWFDGRAVGAFKTDVQIELHLMVENPLPIIEYWKQHVPTFVRAIVSAEMHRPLGTVVSHVRDMMGLEIGVAINPETPLSEIGSVLHDIDQLTIMSVHPGFQGQSFGDPERVGGPEYIFEKVRRARTHYPDLWIEIDGGVTPELIPHLLEAGVNRIGIGSTIFGSEDPQATLESLNALL